MVVVAVVEHPETGATGEQLPVTVTVAVEALPSPVTVTVVAGAVTVVVTAPVLLQVGLTGLTFVLLLLVDQEFQADQLSALTVLRSKTTGLACATRLRRVLSALN